MLNYEEELAKFTPVRTTDMLTQSVREELEQQRAKLRALDDLQAQQRAAAEQRRTAEAALQDFTSTPDAAATRPGR